MNDLISDLILIEAPGKRDKIREAVRGLNFENPVVMATRGMLLDLPRNEIALDPGTLLPTFYEPTHLATFERVTEAFTRAERIWVMTDYDREGEVIAAQIAHLAGDRTIQRVCCNTLDPQAIRNAFSAAGAVDDTLASQGVARRIVDRLIGYGFSDPTRPGAVGIVGRVLSGALAYIQAHPPACSRFEGPMRDGFEVSGVAQHHNLREGMQVAALLREHPEVLDQLPVTEQRVELGPPPPCTGADALLLVSRWLDLPIQTCSDEFQRLYENGLLSYHRSDSSHLGAPAAKMAMHMAREHLAIAPDWASRYAQPARDNSDIQGGHEGLHPVEPVDLTADPLFLSRDEAILNIVGRRVAAAMGRPARVRRETVAPEALSRWVKDETGMDMAEAGLQVRVHRTHWGRATWHSLITPPGPSGVRLPPIPLDRMLLGSLTTSGLGRPSTYVEHIGTIQRRNLVTKRGNLSPAGIEAVNYAASHAPFLLESDRISQFEAVLTHPESGALPLEELVRRAAQACGISQQMARNAIAAHNARNVEATVPAQAAAAGGHAMSSRPYMPPADPTSQADGRNVEQHQ